MFWHQVIFTKCIHVHDIEHCDFVEWRMLTKECGVGDLLCQRLIYMQCSKPPELVTTTAEALDELKLNEDAMQLRGWLVCQSFSQHIAV